LTTTLGARIVVAGVSSGVGKTTVATGLMAALRARGMKVASAKVGPDFIDPGYHSLATGRPGRNLDSWICGEPAIPALAGRAASGADILVVEGVMGLFDGAADGNPEATTASIARLLDAPVLLVVDASAMSGSVAALVHGYRTFDPSIRVAGVVLNRIGSPGHETLLREALQPLGVPVLGALLLDSSFTWRDRHLGLVPVVEDVNGIRKSIARLAGEVTASLDLKTIEETARTAPTWHVEAPPTPRRVGDARVAIAAGPAFSFVYQDNLEALEAAGAELMPFDPRHESSLPEGSTALYAGGGFPEVFVGELSENQPLQQDLREKAGNGLVIWAECGGLLWLGRSLDGHPLTGLVPTEGTMTDRLTLGYRTAQCQVNCPLGSAGETLRGHEFHYSTVTPVGSALTLRSRTGESSAGFATPELFASYLHLHLGSDPLRAERFVSTASSHRSPPRDAALPNDGQPDHLSDSS
jgi:cobyrinic acid a,c-diamide synthase